jgi:hypothetical protein
VLSAWRLGPEPWPLVACVGLVAALAAAMGPVLLGAIPRRTVAAAYAILAGLSGGATVITLASAPDYFSPTPAPFAALGAATVASAVGFARVRALPRGT